SSTRSICRGRSCSRTITGAAPSLCPEGRCLGRAFRCEAGLTRPGAPCYAGSTMSSPARAAALAGIRVIDMSHHATGPWCTSLLGDMGADVIKVEKPGRGDSIRSADRSGRLPPEVGGLNFQGLNRNKRGMTCDISKPAGVALIRRLVAKADVL